MRTTSIGANSSDSQCQTRPGERMTVKLFAAMAHSTNRLSRIAAHPIGASLCLSLGYMVLCGTYVVFSGRIAAHEATSINQLRLFELLKGLAFVVITGAMYFGFAFFLLRRIADQHQQLALLSGHLLRSQDEERLRIARELHDATGQELAAVAMNLGLASHRIAGHDVMTDNLISDSQAILEHCQRELRTLSYRLHPPSLDEVGLVGAVQEYVNGFTERCGIKVTLDAGPNLGRLSADLERALFRVVQESLGNVHRHSGSMTARIMVVRKGTTIILEIGDQGHGLKIRSDGSAAKVGVGLTGMRERVRLLGGRLEIESSGRGTTVRAIVPGTKETNEDPSNSHC